MARQDLRPVPVTGLGGQADGVGQQVLDLPENFGAAGKPSRQRGQRLRECPGLFAVQATRQGQLADLTVPEPLGVRFGRGQVAPRQSRQDGSR